MSGTSEKQLINPHQKFCQQVRATSQITQKRFGLSWQETAHLANQHTLAVQSWLSSRSPQAERFTGTGTIATKSGLKAAFLNLVLGSHFPPEAKQTVINPEIEAIKSFFSQSETPFRWLLSPLCVPSDMGVHLVQHGLKAAVYHLPTMVAPLPLSMGLPSSTRPIPNPHIEIWQANSLSDLRAASTIRRIAFRFGAGVALTYFEDMADDWLQGNPARLYMARLEKDGPPVAIGALIMGNGLPGVYVMATLPQWERRGLGKALLTRILSEATVAGHQLIVLTSGAQAYSLYRKFGFEHIFEYKMYSLP